MMASMPVALMPFLQNSRVAALSNLPRADSASPAAKAAAADFFLETDLPMRLSKSERGKIIKPHLHAPKIIASEAATASPLSKASLIKSEAALLRPGNTSPFVLQGVWHASCRKQTVRYPTSQ